MIGWLIVACEIGFWLFIAAGLAARYVFKRKKAGIVLLACTPLIDLLLLAATVADLQRGAVATVYHGLAAIYIGVSLVYGKRMIEWADRRFAYRFAGGPKPVKRKTYGAEHARVERAGWFRHFLAWLIGSALLLLITVYTDRGTQTLEWMLESFREETFQFDSREEYPTAALVLTVFRWFVVLAIDFVISFSYTLFPRPMPNARRF